MCVCVYVCMWMCDMIPSFVHRPIECLICCSVLQCVSVCFRVFQCIEVFCRVLQCVAVCCSVLQCVAVCCSVLQCVSECFRVFQCIEVFCRVLQGVAVCCSVLQCVAVCPHSHVYHTPIECLIFLGLFPQTSPTIHGSFSKKDLHNRASCCSMASNIRLFDENRPIIWGLF